MQGAAYHRRTYCSIEDFELNFTGNVGHNFTTAAAQCSVTCTVARLHSRLVIIAQVCSVFENYGLRAGLQTRGQRSCLHSVDAVGRLLREKIDTTLHLMVFK